MTLKGFLYLVGISFQDHNLLESQEDDSGKYLTSDERRKRHGERKRLGGAQAGEGSRVKEEKSSQTRGKMYDYEQVNYICTEGTFCTPQVHLVIHV